MIKLKNVVAGNILPDQVGSVVSGGKITKAEMKWIQKFDKGKLYVVSDTIQRGFAMNDSEKFKDIKLNKLVACAYTIESRAFQKFRSTEVVISAKRIEENAFSGAVINKLIFSKKVSRIQTKAFYGISGLDTVVLGENISFIGAEAFAFSQINLLAISRATLKKGSLRNNLAEKIYFFKKDGMDANSGATILQSGAIEVKPTTKEIIIDDPDLVLSRGAIIIHERYNAKYNLKINIIHASTIKKGAIRILNLDMQGITIIDQQGNSHDENSDIVEKGNGYS